MPEYLNRIRRGTDPADRREGGTRRSGTLLAIALVALLTGACTWGSGLIPPPAGPGQVYVADTLNDRIVRVNDMTGAGWTTLGTRGPFVNQFMEPVGIFVDGTGRIYVTDLGNGRIVRVNDMTGAGWTTFGTRGPGVNQFNSALGIFVR